MPETRCWGAINQSMSISTLPYSERQRLRQSLIRNLSWVSRTLLKNLLPNLPPGIYIQLMIGPTGDSKAQIIQYVGIIASILSVTKGCSDWWIKNRSEDVKDAPIFKTLKASLFFLPHVLFRTSAFAFSAAFLGYFSLAPITLAPFVVGCCCCLCCVENEGGMNTFLVTIFLPIAAVSGSSGHRALMKRAIIAFTTVLLMTLTFIRQLPVMIQPDILVSTYGLRHLNFRILAGTS